MKIRMNSWEKNWFHVIGKTVDKKPWPLPMIKTWEVFSECLDFVHKDGVEATHAFLLMNNHYHWICDLGGDPPDMAALEWFHELAHTTFLHAELNETGFYNGPCLPITPTSCRIEHIKQYQTTYRYLYRNPVEAGLVSKVEDYPFSTLTYVLGKDGLSFTCMDQMNLIYSPIQLLKWLNSSFEKPLP